MADFSYELALSGLVCGVDEAGRGPCAGPVCVAAVILDPARVPEGITDSKMLTEKRRFELEPQIKASAIAWSVVHMSIDDIETLNIFGATMEGMRRCVAALNPCADHALIDGNKCPPLTIPSTAIVKGDLKSLSIAAASILAKTARDRHMIEMDALYPVYGFKKHKGYQSELHLEALRLHGPCPIHRPSWATLRNLGDNEVMVAE
ncbi:ribonuclease HII [Asticcacaulis sp. EMRT-3]|uniref:ribonuclease HII n=1 Tax=Asticcacaulis sp. EMRT-3 TaxID=3040349 RepID=UPI0024AEF24C|nr:ribonuclease HII [Asticcacaulis sp. EMRT-3]MDI7774897.1 ribonuclease HII [Asticcacaulis sp. EMRT-3]